MSKRQKRIILEGSTSILIKYMQEEVNVVCNSGAVYHGVLYRVESEYILLKDLSGSTVKLFVKELKEMILDYVSQ
jgi:ferredoxin-fold anticodon binding domain-containing protein